MSWCWERRNLERQCHNVSPEIQSRGDESQNKEGNELWQGHDVGDLRWKFALCFPLIYFMIAGISLTVLGISLLILKANTLLLMKWRSENHSIVASPLGPHGLYSPWNSPGQNTGLGSCSLLQGIFSTHGSNPCLPHCRWILYQLSHQGSPSSYNVDYALMQRLESDSQLKKCS